MEVLQAAYRIVHPLHRDPSGPGLPGLLHHHPGEGGGLHRSGEQYLLPRLQGAAGTDEESGIILQLCFQRHENHPFLRVKMEKKGTCGNLTRYDILYIELICAFL